MTVGILTLEIHLPQARSLKDKRQVMRSLKERLRSRHNVAVSELEEHADLWQRSEIAVVSVASRREPLEQLFDTVLREAESQIPGHVSQSGCDYIEGSDGGPGGWEEDWA
jgi:uncharacterized protein YlxP (DUF503 family)